MRAETKPEFHIGRGADMLAAAGRAIGVALGHYLVWLGCSAAATGAPRLHFLSREGAWLAGHYARLRSARPDGGNWPQPVALAVSRRSTFLPSLPRVDTQTLMPLVAQYRNVSAMTLLRSLGLDMPPAGTRPGPAADLPLEAGWGEPGVAQRILGDIWIAGALEQRRVAQRAALLRYLAQEAVGDAGPLAVADIGWRGTIHDNLARLLPDRTITGLYFALFAPFAPAPPNVEKRGFILGPTDSRRLARRLRFVAPLEFVASGQTPTTLEYELDENGARPVLDTMSVVPFASPAFTLLQQAVAAAIDEAALTTTPSASLARQHVLRFLEAPPASLVHLFFDGWRDDRYGAGSLRRGAPPLQLKRLIAALSSRPARRAFGIELTESAWPWGLLVRDMPIVAPLLRHCILGLDARL